MEYHSELHHYLSQLLRYLRTTKVKTVKPKLFPASSLHAAARGLTLASSALHTPCCYPRSLFWITYLRLKDCPAQILVTTIFGGGRGEAHRSLYKVGLLLIEGGSLPKQNKKNSSAFIFKFQVCPKPSIPPAPILFWSNTLDVKGPEHWGKGKSLNKC